MNLKSLLDRTKTLLTINFVCVGLISYLQKMELASQNLSLVLFLLASSGTIVGTIIYMGICAGRNYGHNTANLDTSLKILIAVHSWVTIISLTLLCFSPFSIR
jgi:hypothetical protein